MRRSASVTRSRGSSTPSSRRNAVNGMRMFGTTRRSRYTSMTAYVSPPATSRSRSVARRSANGTSSGERSQENRLAASVHRFSRIAVRPTPRFSNFATSSTTSRVSAPISVFSPPMTPAIPTARDSSAITSTEGSRIRSTSSSVRRLAHVRTEDRGDLTREPEHAKAIGAIRLQFADEDAFAERFGERLTHLVLSVQDEDPLVVLAEAELLLGHDHALAAHAEELRRLQRRAFAGLAIDVRRADLGVRNDLSLLEVRRAGDDLQIGR